MPSFTFSQSHLVAGTVSLPGLMFDIQVSQIHAAYPKRSEEDGSYVKQKPAHSWYDLLLLGIHLRWQLQCVKCETQGPCLISVPKPHVGQRNMRMWQNFICPLMNTEQQSQLPDIKYDFHRSELERLWAPEAACIQQTGGETVNHRPQMTKMKWWRGDTVDDMHWISATSLLFILSELHQAHYG